MKRSPEVQAFIKANAKKGGLSTRRKYGKAHFRRMGKLGVEARRMKKASVENPANPSLTRDK